MKNKLLYLMIMLSMIMMFSSMQTCIYAAGTTASSFYAMEINEDDGSIISGDTLPNDGRIYDLDLKSNESIILVFFNENGELLKSSGDILKTEEVYRAKDKEAEFIDDNSTKYEDYKYANEIMYIDGFLDGKVAGTVSYNGSSVNFSLNDFTYQTVASGDNGWTLEESKYYSLNGYGDEGEGAQYYYARFYYNYNQLPVANVSFIDDDGNKIDESVIKGEYYQEADAWRITYTQNVSGTVILETQDAKTYEMPLIIDCYEIYFGDKDGEEIDKLVYVSGESEEFYLYNWCGKIEVTKGSDNVTVTKENERLKFTVDKFEEKFTYRIVINDETYKINICSLKDAFHAKEVKLDGNNYIVENEMLDEITLFENELKYFVFYCDDEPVQLTKSSNTVNIIISKNVAFTGKDLEDFVYEVSLDNASKEKVTIEYEDNTMRILKEDELTFFEYGDGELNEIKKGTFTYTKDEAENFYLYVEGRTLDVSEITIIEGQDYVTPTNGTLTVDDELINVVKISVKDTMPDEFDFEIFVSKWNVTANVTVEKESSTTPITPSALPLCGFYTSYTDMTTNTFMGNVDDYDENEFEYIYTPGDVFYYVWDEEDSFISGDCKVSSKTDIDLKLVDTGRDITINNVTYDRYAVEITIPSDAEGTMTGNLLVYYHEAADISENRKENIDLKLIDPYDLAPIGETTMEYNDEEYVIGFAGSPYIVSTYENNYPVNAESDVLTKERNIRIFKVTETEVAGEEVFEYTEVEELYDNIKSVDAYIAKFNIETLEYEDVSEQVSGDISVENIARNVDKHTDEEYEWYVEVLQRNVPYEYYLVADITMDDDEVVTISMEYNSYKDIIITKDLRDEKEPWGLSEINTYINSEDVQNSDANVIRIFLDSSVEYGSGDDTKVLVLQGKKEIEILGNGATIIGRVIANSPVMSGKTPLHKLLDIHFISDVISTDENNVCLEGNGEIEATNCSFEGYYIAVNMYAERTLGVKKAINSCIFENNTYGIYIDGQGRKSKFEETIYRNKIKNCRFVNNEIGVYIVEQKELSTVDELIEFAYCEFIDNETDIVNNSEFRYLVYGCVFADTSSDPSLVIEAREPKTKNINMSYVYRELILSLDQFGFVIGHENLPDVAYPPYTSSGGLGSLTYINGSSVGIGASALGSPITVSNPGTTLSNPLILGGTWNSQNN